MVTGELLGYYTAKFITEEKMIAIVMERRSAWFLR